MSTCRQETYFFRAMNLRPISAGIEPAFFGVACYAVGAGTDIASAIILMPDGGRKFGDVNIVARQDVLKNGAIIDDLMFDDFRIDEIFFTISVGKFPFGQMLRKTQRHISPRTGEHVHQHAETLGASFDIFKYNAGAILLT